MAQKILTVGLQLASDDVTYEEFTSRTSLLDWDIVLFRPVIDEFINHHDVYKGKPSLSDTWSFKLKESCEHWRREIRQAVDAGKTVVIFLAPIHEVYIDTGDRQYSGSGRNRSTTRLVSLFSNYSCLPIALGPTNARGSAVKLASKGADVIAPYWSQFATYSEYNVLLDGPDLQPCLVTRNGDRPVGILKRSENSNGSLICLPDIDFFRDEFFQDIEGDPEGEDTSWSKEANRFAARMVSAVVTLDAALRGGGEITPEPVWASDEVFSLLPEAGLRKQLLEVESKIERLQQEKESVGEKLTTTGKLRGLLYEKGRPLEKAIIDALHLLGFSAKPYKDKNSEFDVVFESLEGRLIGEVEGKDAKAVNIDKLRQLTMNIHEDLQHEEVISPAKGVLFGNGFRLLPPKDRDGTFTEKCVVSAKSLTVALVATSDLFLVAQHLSAHRDEAYATKCRRALLAGIGLTSFPALPTGTKDGTSKIPRQRKTSRTKLNE